MVHKCPSGNPAGNNPAGNNGYYVLPIQKEFQVVMMVGGSRQSIIATCERESDATLIAKLLNKHEGNWMVRPDEILLEKKAEPPQEPTKKKSVAMPKKRV